MSALPRSRGLLPALVTTLALALLGGCVEDLPATAEWPARPRVIRGEAPLGYVSNNGRDTISVIALRTMDEIARVPVGRIAIDPEAPHHLAIDAARGFVYVGLSNVSPAGATGPHAGHTGGTRDSYVQRLRLSDLEPDGDFRVDRDLGDIVLTPDGSRVLTSHFDLPKAIDAITMGLPIERGWANLVVGDAMTMQRLARIPVCIAPHGVTVTADGAIALLACYGDDRIAVVDLGAEPPAVAARVAVGGTPSDVPPPRYGPYSVITSPDGTRAFVGNLESDDLRTLTIAPDHTVTLDASPLSLGAAVYFGAFSPDGARFWAPTQGPDELVLVDASAAAPSVTRTRTFELDECVAPHEATYVPELDRVVLVCEGDHRGPGKVISLDPATLATTGEVVVDVYPDALRVVHEVTW